MICGQFSRSKFKLIWKIHLILDGVTSCSFCGHVRFAAPKFSPAASFMRGGVFDPNVGNARLVVELSTDKTRHHRRRNKAFRAGMRLGVNCQIKGTVIQPDNLEPVTVRRECLDKMIQRALQFT